MTESSPTVSIVLPTYNGERYLQRAIESCLEQTHQNIELVVVDDCSTDSTPEIIQSFTTTSTSRPCSIWTSAATPAVASNNDPQAIEIGVRFQSDKVGYRARLP